ncbi:hypothetical protein [Streptomyces sp. NPDC094032]|uniref:hypothetical protein n=1 Tax=Streptomyces sp. NPDC094032 TaxID=3155308 RepID=UPI00332E984B
MSLTSALVINAVVLAAVLGSDLGHRRFDSRSVRRSLIICAAVAAYFVRDFYTSGTGLVVQITGVAAGVLVGLLAVSLMKVTRHPDDTVHTYAGAAYATVWVGMSVLRSLISIGLTYWFGTAVGTWLVEQGAAPAQITGIITNFFVFMAVTAIITRSLAIRARAAALPATRAFTG